MKKTIAVLVSAVLGLALVPVISLAGGSFYIDNITGFVGIGNTTPASNLDVSGAMYSRLVAASSTTIDWNAGNVQTMTLSSSPTLTFSNAQAGGKYDLILNQDGTGGRTITWPANVKWLDGRAPVLDTTANGVNVANFIYDGTNYLGSYTQKVVHAVAFDAASIENNISGTNTSITGNPITVSNVDGDTLLLAGITSTVPLTSLSVTYNGVSMTLMETFNPYSSTQRMYIFGLLNPTTGSAISPIATFSSTAYPVAIQAASYTGVDQSALPSVVATDHYTSPVTSYNSSLTTDSTPGSWVAMFGRNEYGTFTAGSGTTIRDQVPGDGLMWADSNGIVTPSSSYSMAASWGGVQGWANIMLEISPAQ